ncbi:transmembrane prolyl 4-hydroxylase-like [Dendronephthya gigantea]|uniref:transmembrane prolyl 4-hydroxylase-like n=1 Tax=Dendronephthya gigantea TaxID=151771 RepID=UPI00106A571D|nr:transmembrane prolyl 4-hydroxylase-like [Dendronephthya gigantea]
MLATRFLLCLALIELDKLPTVLGLQNYEDGPCFYEQSNDGKLFKIEGVKVGYRRDLHLDGDEKKYRVTTIAMKPTIFEISNFLSDRECDHVKNLAKKNGLKESVAGFEEQAYKGEIEDALTQAETENYVLHLPEFVDYFHEWDKNGDSFITMDEVKEMCERSNGLFFTENEINDMFSKINYTYFDDGRMNEEEFNLLPFNKLDAYLNFIHSKHPFHRPRYSEHTWLSEQKDPILTKIYDRIIRLTQLPRKLVEGSENIQIVKYNIRGHYHAHYDSTPEDFGKNVVCCHQNHDKDKECKLCRILTVLYYLNDVEEGGETAFLVADNKTLNVKYLKSLNKMFNLSKRCHTSNLLVPAKKGTAIMWYNHEVDPRSGWLGDLDYHTIHGGCDVLSGEKWIANSWINAPTPDSAHVSSLFYR